MKPQMHLTGDKSIRAAPWGLPVYHYYCEGASEFVFTENETNNQLLFRSKNTGAHVKDAFHDYVVHGKTDTVNPAGAGTKASPCPIHLAHRFIRPSTTAQRRLTTSTRCSRRVCRRKPQ